MSMEPSKKVHKDHEVPCQLLPPTEFDMAEVVPLEQRDRVPVGGLLRDEHVHEATELDFSPAQDEEP